MRSRPNRNLALLGLTAVLIAFNGCSLPTPPVVEDTWTVAVPDLTAPPTQQTWKCPEASEDEDSYVSAFPTRDDDTLAVLCSQNQEDGTFLQTLIAFSVSQQRTLWSLKSGADFTLNGYELTVPMDVGNGRWLMEACPAATEMCSVGTGYVAIDSSNGKVVDSVFLDDVYDDYTMIQTTYASKTRVILTTGSTITNPGANYVCETDCDPNHLYGFDPQNLAKGPVWEKAIAPGQNQVIYTDFGRPTMTWDSLGTTIELAGTTAETQSNITFLSVLDGTAVASGDFYGANATGKTLEAFRNGTETPELAESNTFLLSPTMYAVTFGFDTSKPKRYFALIRADGAEPITSVAPPEYGEYITTPPLRNGKLAVAPVYFYSEAQGEGSGGSSIFNVETGEVINPYFEVTNPQRTWAVSSQGAYVESWGEDETNHVISYYTLADSTKPIWSIELPGAMERLAISGNYLVISCVSLGLDETGTNYLLTLSN